MDIPSTLRALATIWFAMTGSVPISDGDGGPRSATWVVMGGGAVKGLAHVGAWKAIRESRIAVAGINFGSG